MIRGFYSSVSSLLSQQTNLNTIANNMANVGTTAFKPQRTAFSTMLYSEMNGGAGTMLTVGNGVNVTQTGIDFTVGSLQQTGLPLDFAITGEGFFALENDESDEPTYTRDGSFKVIMDGDDAYLGNATGNYVLDAEGDRIELQKAVITVGEEKTETETGEWDYTAIVPGVYTFPNQYELKLLGGNQYAATERSGEAEAVEVEEPPVMQGFLESSQVQLSQEMVRMIEASKGFSFGAKLVQTADEIEKTVNQLRQ